jgi:hypothetical protein
MDSSTPPCLVDGRRACDPIEDRLLGLRVSNLDYLRHVEQLANAVCDAAADEDWYLETGGTALQDAINEPAKGLRHLHFEGDGCLDGDRP